MGRGQGVCESARGQGVCESARGLEQEEQAQTRSIWFIRDMES